MFLLTLIWPLAAAEAVGGARIETATVYGYHLKPPFILDTSMNRGLYFDFSTYINARLGYELLQTEYMPRKRLEADLPTPRFNGLVIGVNPLWFHDPKEEKYYWTAPIMRDRDEVVSRQETRFEYNGPESLIGKTVGLSLGYYYFGVDELVAKGKVTREDTDGELQNLQKLLRGRVDVIIISRSTLDYYMKHNNEHRSFYISGRPHDVFDRRVLIPKHRKDIYDQIAPIVAKMDSDPLWISMMAGYR